MLAILSLVTGFISPFLPDVLGYFRDKQNNAHELEMLKESNQSKRDIADVQAQADLARADVDDVISARRGVKSYGARLLDAMEGERGRVMRFVRGTVILALAFIEVLNGLMRPYAVYLILSMWASVKLSRILLAYGATVGSGAIDWQSALGALATALTAAWDDHDFMMVDYVIGFLFGSRHQLKLRGDK